MTALVTLPLHGLGGRSDLPAPGWLVTYSAVVIVLASFFVLGGLWRHPRFQHLDGGTRLRLPTVLTASWVRMLTKALALVAFVAFLLVAWLGAADSGERNPAPTWFYVWFWVGLVPLSLLLGPVWSAINPLRTLAAGVRTVLRSRPLALPDAIGYWPAALGLLAFLWLELVYDEAASTRVVAAFVSAYAIMHVGAGLAFGARWFTRCDAFEVYACMLARASPIGRTPEGRVVLRNPLRGLAATPGSPDLTPVVLVVLGSTGFDGLSRTAWWGELVSGTGRADYLLLGTVGLFGCCAAVGVTYGGAVMLMRPFLRAPVGSIPPLFAHTIVPIAIGYTVAHYFSFVVFQGQQGAILGSDPLGRGWDLIGLRDAAVNHVWLSTTVISLVQVAAIVLGHVMALVLAHDRALTLLRPREVVRGQAAMVTVMVLYTGVGIALVAA